MRQFERGLCKNIFTYLVQRIEGYIGLLLLMLMRVFEGAPIILHRLDVNRVFVEGRLLEHELLDLPRMAYIRDFLDPERSVTLRFAWNQTRKLIKQLLRCFISLQWGLSMYLSERGEHGDPHSFI